MGLPRPLPEYRFDPHRRWRFDYCFPEHKISVEIEGGIWTGGRHIRGRGFEQDLMKYNEAALLGYIVLRVTPEMLSNGEVFALLERAFKVDSATA